MNEKKTVRLFLGEGADRVEVGTAEVEHREGGGFIMGKMDITNPEYRDVILGSWKQTNPLIREQGPELSIGGDWETS
jgi:hypothetical protein